MIRPNRNNMKNIYLTVFVSYYFKPAKVKNDDQPDCLNDDETMVDSLRLTLPKKVKLSVTLAIHRRNIKISLSYHKPNENLFPEDYAHHLLILCYTFF